MEEKKVMTIEEMQQECVACAFEIAKLRSMANKHQRRFDDLSYQIWKLQKEQENEQKSTEEGTK